MTVSIDAPLVQRLIAQQFPQWADLPVRPVDIGGWDNRTFHLGDHMSARLPSGEEYADKVEKEQFWLLKLAPQLPLPIPVPLAMGQPGEGYPWKWSVYKWIEGETAAVAAIPDMSQFASDLADFLQDLERIDATGGYQPEFGNFPYIGGLVAYDDQTRQALEILKDKIEAKAALHIWETALATTWRQPPVWVHGDISAGNLLARNGKLSAVIDFGGLAIGDPACDLVIAWKFFRKEARDVFKEKLPFDAGTWARGRAWALWKALILAAGIVESNPFEDEIAWATIEEVLRDQALQ